MKNKRLVLFDFDGTITTKDSFMEFLIFYTGRLKFFLGLLILSPVLAAYFLKLIPNWKGKQIFLRWFFGGADLTAFNSRCRDFSGDVLPKLIRPRALEAIKQYQREGAAIAVVSASGENWVMPWSEQQGIICLATQLDVQDGKITGSICGENCFGPEKVKRIEKHFTLSDFDEIVVYGDSVGDREMFAIAHKGYYRPFRIEDSPIPFVLKTKKHTVSK